jgi:hypothetical protein
MNMKLPVRISMLILPFLLFSCEKEDPPKQAPLPAQQEVPAQAAKGYFLSWL